MYMLFCFDSYYPMGGMYDFVGFYPSVEAAKQEAAEKSEDHYQICIGAEIVSSGYISDLQKILP